MAADATVVGVVEGAQPLGLAWRLTPGTVVDGAVPTGVLVRLDGDSTTVPVSATSMIGALIDGQRVMVAQVPPSSVHIIGVAYGDSRWLDGALVTTTGTLLTTSAAVESPITQLALTVPSWRVGHAYMVNVQFTFTTTVATDDWSILIRRADDGTVLAQATFGIGDLVETPYFRWPVFPLVDERAVGLTVSIIRSAGTGTASVLGAASATSMRTWAGVEYAGARSGLPGAPGGVWRAT